MLEVSVMSSPWQPGARYRAQQGKPVVVDASMKVFTHANKQAVAFAAVVPPPKRDTQTI
ncbi:hypothetical protein [Micromonospora sp. L31]|uniref:hypothetical protein n=1 Tax=Micromonospora sp. L31 TaxID=3452213 RepID=UPI003F8B5E2A